MRYPREAKTFEEKPNGDRCMTCGSKKLIGMTGQIFCGNGHYYIDEKGEKKVLQPISEMSGQKFKWVKLK